MSVPELREAAQDALNSLESGPGDKSNPPKAVRLLRDYLAGGTECNEVLVWNIVENLPKVSEDSS